MLITVNSIQYHRNGVCGVGFVRVDFDYTERLQNGERDGSHGLTAIVFDKELDKVAGGTMVAVITPNNADDCWRGDNFADELRKAIANHERDQESQVRKLARRK